MRPSLRPHRGLSVLSLTRSPLSGSATGVLGGSARCCSPWPQRCPRGEGTPRLASRTPVSLSAGAGNSRLCSRTSVPFGVPVSRREGARAHGGPSLRPPHRASSQSGKSRPRRTPSTAQPLWADARFQPCLCVSRSTWSSGHAHATVPPPFLACQPRRASGRSRCAGRWRDGLPLLPPWLVRCEVLHGLAAVRT